MEWVHWTSTINPPDLKYLMLIRKGMDKFMVCKKGMDGMRYFKKKL